MRSDGSLAALIGARCFVEAVLFTAVASIAHAVTDGREALPAVGTTLVLFGLALLLVTILREVGAERRSTTVLVLTLAAGVAWGLVLPTSRAEGFSVVSRVLLFGLLAEAFLWRVVSVARGPTHWTDARNAIPAVAAAITFAIFAPGEIDRAAFAPLALLALAASATALSLARTIEELALSRGTVGTARVSAATSVTVVIALAAIAMAAFAPAMAELLAGLGDLLGPAAARVLYVVVLPFAYLAAFVVDFLRPLVTKGKLERPQLREVTPEQDAEMLRQMEAARPFVFGALGLIVVAIAAIFAIVLLDRMLRERRRMLPAGVSLEREAAPGIGLLDTLRSLRPRAAARRRRPRDDRTSAGAIRVAYWRFLAAAERAGVGWRAEAETPLEHEQRIGGQDARWRGAAPVVRAFEDVRYGELEPDEATVERAREAVRLLEARPR